MASSEKRKRLFANALVLVSIAISGWVFLNIIRLDKELCEMKGVNTVQHLGFIQRNVESRIVQKEMNVDMKVIKETVIRIDEKLKLRVP